MFETKQDPTPPKRMSLHSAQCSKKIELRVEMKKETTRLIVRGMLFALYLAMGMIVFKVLEAPNEQQGILKAKKAIAHVLTKCNISQQELRKLVEIITEAEHWGFTTGWLEKWSYTGALFFSGTVITTIGALTVCV